MTRLDYLLDNLSAAVERRRRLEDIERRRWDDWHLVASRDPCVCMETYAQYQAAHEAAQEHRQAADQSVLAIAVDIADQWREK